VVKRFFFSELHCYNTSCIIISESGKEYMMVSVQDDTEKNTYMVQHSATMYIKIEISE